MTEGYYLFDLDNKSFLSFIETLTVDEIKSNKEKLFPEAVDFIKSGKISDYLAFDFYKRNKKYVLRDAENFFIDRINKELLFTGESHYLKIAEAIDQINMINRERAGKISDELRTNYKRRTSLIKMIDRF